MFINNINKYIKYSYFSLYNQLYYNKQFFCVLKKKINMLITNELCFNIENIKNITKNDIKNGNLLNNFNKEIFQINQEIVALDVDKYICSSIKSILKKDYLYIKKGQKNIIQNQNNIQNRYILLNQKIQNINELPVEVKEKLDQYEYNVTNYSLLLTYDDFSYYEIMNKILNDYKIIYEKIQNENINNENNNIFSYLPPPPQISPPSHNEQIGHITHFNLRPYWLPFRKLIGQVYFDKFSPRTRMVVNKSSSIESKFRTFPMEIIGGDSDNFEVSIKENNIIFELDFSKVYWNSRLSYEHERLIELVSKDKTKNNNIVIADVFAGIGPFAIPLVKNKNCHVLANDLNPESFYWLKNNGQKNKCKIIDNNNNNMINKKHGMLECFNLDGRDFIRHLVLNRINETFYIDHIIMNLPKIAIEFLDVFRGLPLHNHLPMIHVHCFQDLIGDTEEDLYNAAINRLSNALGIECNRQDVQVHHVRDVAPRKPMLCLSFRLPLEVCNLENIYNNKNEEEKKNDDDEPLKKKQKLTK